MIASVRRLLTVALVDWQTAIRNRRILVVFLLFAVLAGGVMYASVSALSTLEAQVLETLKLPPSSTPGAVTLTLWKSKPFVRFVEAFTANGLVFADIQGEHPLLLVYAIFLFQVVALLTLMVSAPRIADDLRSGAARYQLLRVSRTEWSLGKYLGEALMILSAVLVGGFVAWGVLVWRLPAKIALPLFVGVLNWSARAAVYALAWLGLFLGLSHIVKSGGKATALGLFALLGAALWPLLLRNLVYEYGCPAALEHLDVFVPRAAWTCLWRRSPAVLFQGVVHLLSLGLFYLALGSSVFRRRDV